MFDRNKAWRYGAFGDPLKSFQRLWRGDPAASSRLIEIEADEDQALHDFVSNGPVRRVDVVAGQRCLFRNLAARGLLRTTRRDGDLAWTLSQAGWARLRMRRGA